MQLVEEHPGSGYVLRAVTATGLVINGRLLTGSLILMPDRLIEDWRHGDPLCPADLEPVLALAPELIVLGTGSRQRFPAPAVLGACLGRGIGIEVMDNAAAGRTFNVLAAENRRVAAAFVLEAGPGQPSRSAIRHR